MRRRGLTLLTALISGALALTALGPAAARAVPVAGRPALSRAAHARPAPAATAQGPAGFLHWTDFPVQDPTTAYNSTGGTVTATQEGLGDVRVSFAGFGFSAGAQVSTSARGATCSVTYLTPALGGTLFPVVFDVRCYNSAGTPASVPFDLAVSEPSSAPPGGVLDYALVYDGASGDLTSNPAFRAFQYNSAGKANTVQHDGTGQYVVTFPGSGQAGNSRGTVAVTPYGAGGGSCQAMMWTASATAQQIIVRCFGPSGARQDREFTVAYARGTSLLGQDGLTAANATVNGTGAQPVYQPGVQFDSVAKARVSVVRIDPGEYVVLFGGSSPTGKPNGGNGHITITPVDGSYRRCGYSLAPTHTPELDVTCTNAAGQAVDTKFTVQWVVG